MQWQSVELHAKKGWSWGDTAHACVHPCMHGTDGDRTGAAQRNSPRTWRLGRPPMQHVQQVLPRRCAGAHRFEALVDPLPPLLHATPGLLVGQALDAGPAGTRAAGTAGTAGLGFRVWDLGIGLSKGSRIDGRDSGGTVLVARRRGMRPGAEQTETDGAVGRGAAQHLAAAGRGAVGNPLELPTAPHTRTRARPRAYLCRDLL